MENDLNVLKPPPVKSLVCDQYHQMKSSLSPTSYLIVFISVNVQVGCGKKVKNTKHEEKLTKKKGSSDVKKKSSEPVKSVQNEAVPKEEKKEAKEKMEKKEEVDPDEAKEEGKKLELKKSSKEDMKENKGEKPEDKKEERRLSELKPKQIKRNEKEERIAQGKEVRNKGDYPTFNDVESDWDSDKDKKGKNKKAEGSGKDHGEDNDKLLSEKKTQSLSQELPPNTFVVVEPANTTVAATGGRWTQLINNRGDKRLIFKVRCSNNNEYRVNPVYGFVDASGNAYIEVTRLNGAPKDDRLVVQYAVAPPDATDPRAAFAELQPEGNLTINVVAA
ncbi:hypothetical protein V3C99_008807 [Haemonchus contortus]